MSLSTSSATPVVVTGYYAGMNHALTSVSVPMEVFWWAILSLILLTNTTTLAAIHHTPALAKAKLAVFVRGLCVSDMLVGLAMLLESVGRYGGLWPISPTLTEDQVRVKAVFITVLSFPYMLGTLTSHFTMLTVAVDRYVAISRPFVYKTWFTRRAGKVTLLVIWLYSLSLVSFGAIYFTLGAPAAMVAAATNYYDPWSTMAYLVFHGFHSVALICPSVVLFIITLLALRKQQKSLGNMMKDNVQRARSHGRYTRMLACTLVVFLVCVIPICIMDVTVDPMNPDTPQYQFTLLFAGFILFYSNSWVNAFIYSHFNKEYSSAYRQLFNRCPLFKRLIHPHTGSDTQETSQAQSDTSQTLNQ